MVTLLAYWKVLVQIMFLCQKKDKSLQCWKILFQKYLLTFRFGLKILGAFDPCRSVSSLKTRTPI